MRQIPPLCFRMIGTLVLLVGLNGCMGREHPFRLTPTPLPKPGETQELEDNDKFAAKKKGSKTSKSDEDPPLPSSLVSPDDAPERRTYDTAKSIRPLTMSDSPDAFVPQSGRYAVPDGLTEQETVALRQGLPAEVERGMLATNGAIGNGDTTSTTAAMAAGAEPMDIDPTVASARSLSEMMDASSSANFAKNDGSEAFSGGMPNPMTGLSEAPLQSEPVDYARVGPQATQTPDDLPGTPDQRFMTAAPASSLSAILPSGNSNETAGSPQAPTPKDLLAANGMDQFDMNRVTPVAGNVPAFAPTSVAPIPTEGTPGFTGASGTAVTPWAFGAPETAAVSVAVNGKPGANETTATNGVTATSGTLPSVLASSTPATAISNTTTPVGTAGTLTAPVVGTPANTANTAARSGRCNFRPGSTRTATLPMTGIVTPIPIASSTSTVTGQTVTANDAATEVRFTPPQQTGTAATPTTSISLTPVNDRFFR